MAETIVGVAKAVLRHHLGEHAVAFVHIYAGDVAIVDKLLDRHRSLPDATVHIVSSAAVAPHMQFGSDRNQAHQCQRVKVTFSALYI